MGFSAQVPYNETDTAVTFRWKNLDGENENTVWSAFPEETNYFKPSGKEFMNNYIVRDMDCFLAKLENSGINVDRDERTYSYGRFSWIMDPEGNKIEFCEPDREFFADKYD